MHLAPSNAIVGRRITSKSLMAQNPAEEVYSKLANIYDLLFGVPLNRGRLEAIQRMPIAAHSRVLEVGVGTGLTLALYPKHAWITGIDLSASMLEKARERVGKEVLPNVRLLEMDAADLRFADNSFDIVYAPYLISAVKDPVRVVREMTRVCRRGGRIVLLNHFLSSNFLLSRFERLISPLTIRVGFKSDLDLPAFLAQVELTPLAIEKVNRPKIWSLVTCAKE